MAESIPVLLYREGEAIDAIGAVCSHAGGPLEDGSFADGCVECPWHNSVFDLRDGHVVHGPATFDEPHYQVRIQDGQIEVRNRLLDLDADVILVDEAPHRENGRTATDEILKEETAVDGE
ncbi:MAG: Rieske (2Fe-2S) protein [Anaerolineae bacterium]|nr:Rieske (2Fe-2S) protein [Anaerolineae bacterium]